MINSPASGVFFFLDFVFLERANCLEAEIKGAMKHILYSGIVSELNNRSLFNLTMTIEANVVAIAFVYMICCLKIDEKDLIDCQRSPSFRTTKASLAAQKHQEFLQKALADSRLRRQRLKDGVGTVEKNCYHTNIGSETKD